MKKFWEIFNKRKDNLYYLLEKTRDLQKYAWFNSEEEHEVVSPHAFSVTLKNPKYNMKELYKFLEDNSVKCKRNFGSMPTQHKAFEFLGHRFGEFPEAEYVGDNGLHFGIHQYLSKDDLDYVSGLLHEYFTRFNNEIISLMIPAYTGRRIFIGHRHQTVDYPLKQQLVDQFWAPDAGGDKYVFLKNQSIDWLVVRLDDNQNYGWLDSQQWLKKVITADDLIIYQVQ